MNDPSPQPTGDPPVSDQDVWDAMARMPGYLDISVEDFRQLYDLAREQALERLFRQLRAESLMRTDIEPVRPLPCWTRQLEAWRGRD